MMETIQSENICGDLNNSMKGERYKKIFLYVPGLIEKASVTADCMAVAGHNDVMEILSSNPSFTKS